MPDDPKTARAAEIQKAIEDADRRKADAAVDLGTERASGGNGGKHLDKFLSAMDAMGRKLDDACARMDALEARHKDDARAKDDDARRKRDDDSRKRDDESEEEYEKRMREGGKAKEVVADEVVADSAHRGEFASAQETAEKAYLSWGLRANAPALGLARTRCQFSFLFYQK
jgi:hypothetical protein